MTEARVHVEDGGHRIVVGVDGSPQSTAALTWALGQAERTGAVVEVLHTWHLPEVGELMGLNPYVLEQEAFEEEAASVVRRALADATGPDGVPEGVQVRSLTAMGAAAPALIDAARGADLLVVGARGRGGFVGVLLGSVTRHCVDHAPCPVVVVPSPTSADADVA